MPARVGAAIWPRFKQRRIPLQPIKPLRSSRWPWRHRPLRVGADAAFAKAIARSEFGRFYVDDQQLREVARSLARPRVQGMPTRQVPGGTQSAQASGEEARLAREKLRAKCDQGLWQRPSLREQRTKLAAAKARLLTAARGRALKNAMDEG
jgi:hypothetical protein